VNFYSIHTTVQSAGVKLDVSGTTPDLPGLDSVTPARYVGVDGVVQIGAVAVGRLL